MAVLKLEVVGKSDALSNLQIDGKRVKLKKNRRGPSYCEVEVAGNVAEITVLKSHHYGGKTGFGGIYCVLLLVFSDCLILGKMLGFWLLILLVKSI